MKQEVIGIDGYEELVRIFRNEKYRGLNGKRISVINFRFNLVSENK